MNKHESTHGIMYRVGQVIGVIAGLITGYGLSVKLLGYDPWHNIIYHLFK